MPTMLCAALLLLLVGVAVGCEPPAAQKWYSQNITSLLDRAQAGPPERNQRSSAEAIENSSTPQVSLDLGRELPAC